MRKCENGFGMKMQCVKNTFIFDVYDKSDFNQMIILHNPDSENSGIIN